MGYIISVLGEPMQITEKSSQTAKDKEIVEDHVGLKASHVYEIIRIEGEAELVRRPSALWWSGLAAGLSIGFSVIAEALLATYLPDSAWKPLVDNLGYSVGFPIVILAHQQLFTENTLTAVLPVIKRKKLRWLFAMLRLWGVVLTANIVGCFIFAMTIAYTPMFSEAVHTSIYEISHHLMSNSTTEMFVKGIAAGWLIAVLVWMLPSAEGAEFLVITLITYLIALGDFTHIIAGSAEAFYLFVLGKESLSQVVFHFFLPTLGGNIFGGTLLFAVLSYVQVREEIA